MLHAARCVTSTAYCVSAALFDGHGTGAAADRLNESLYDEFSHAIDDQMLNTVDDLEPCETDGALRGATPSLAQAGRH